MGWGPYEARATLHARGRDRLRALRAPAGAGRRAGGDRARGRGGGARRGHGAAGAGRGRARGWACAIATATAASTSCARRWWWAPTGGARPSRGLVGAERPAARTPTAAAASSPTGETAAPVLRSTAAQWREGARAGHRLPVRRRAGARAADAARGTRRRVRGRPGRASTSARSPRSPRWPSACAGCHARRARCAHALDLPSFFRRVVRARGGRSPGDAGPLQGPGHRAGHPRRAALRPAAGRAGGAGAGRSARARPRPAALGAAARPRVPGDVPVDQPAGARRGDGPLEVELYRRGADDPELTRRFLDVMARTRTPGAAFRPSLKASLALAAARGGPAARRAVAREAARDLRDGIVERSERLRLRLGRARGPGQAGEGDSANAVSAAATAERLQLIALARGALGQLIEVEAGQARVAALGQDQPQQALALDAQRQSPRARPSGSRASSRSAGRSA